MKKFLAAFALSALVGGAAQAATSQNDGRCSMNDIMTATGTFITCNGPDNGNAQTFDPNAAGLFGVSNWQPIASGPFGGTSTGALDVNSHNYSVVAVLLKTGGEFAAYKLSDWFGGKLAFTTANGQGVTNFVVIGTSPAPLPAAALMLLAGLGGLAMVRRRKTA